MMTISLKGVEYFEIYKSGYDQFAIEDFII